MSKINLNTPEASVRENRLGSISCYAGTAGGLINCVRCGNLKDKNRSFSQSLGCSASPASCLLLQIQDAVLINHGPIGCSSCLHEYEFAYKINAKNRAVKNITQRRIFSTDMEEKDTIYGGSKKLEIAIREVFNKVKPNAIFITTSCASGIIGDDIDSIANEATQELGIPVVAVFCEGFRSRIWTSGFDASYHAVARKIVQKPLKKQNDLVNIINFWGTDVFSSWFKQIGLRTNYITPYATIDQIAHCAEAVTSVQICSTLGSYFAAALEQAYGVPEVKTSAPFGIAQTDRWFRELGRMTHKEKEVEDFLQKQKELWLPKIEELRTKLKGKSAYIAAGASHGHSLLALIRELGMAAAGASIYHHDPQYDNENIESDTLQHVINDYGDINHYSVCNKQEFEIANVLSKIKPDILIARHGGMTRWGAKNGIPSLMVMDEHYGIGYEGIIKYGEKIYDTIQNDEFVKNLQKHAINPYTKWWLEQDPYLFIGGQTNENSD